MKRTIIFFLIGIMLLAGCKTKNFNENNNPGIENQKDDIIDENVNNNNEKEDKETDEQELENENEASEEEKNIIYYMGKLKDKNFVSKYGDVNEPSIWYTAAEELGVIGKPAIPYLINNLSTTDSYEKGLTLYALLLASQDGELMKLTNNEYIEAGLTFTPQEQDKYTQNALIWWDKYKSLF